MLARQHNYTAWDVDENLFPQKGEVHQQISFLLKYAVLAPSAHNTQPWLFEVGNGFINIYIDKRKALNNSDPELRQTYESIGACVENIVLSAEHFGFDIKIENHAPNEGHRIGVCKIIFFKAQKKNQEDDNLFTNITKRHSAKLNYKPIPLPVELRAKVFQLAENDAGVELIVIEEKHLLSKAAEVVAYGTELAFQWPEFCEELRNWVRPNWTRKHDGMPCFTMGIPTAFSGVIPHLFGRVPLAKPQATMVRKQVEESSAVGVLIGRNEKGCWLNAGRIYQKIALKLVSAGWHSAVMGAPIELEKASVKLGEILDKPGRPILFFRIGKQIEALRRSPRRPAHKCLI